MSMEESEEYSRRGCAYHEAGHAVALLMGGFKKVTREISVIPDGHLDGYAEIGLDDILDVLLQIKNGDETSPIPVEYAERYLLRGLPARVIILLSGRAAEMKFFGIKTGFRSSAGDDYKKVRKYVAAMGTDKKERALIRSFEGQSKEFVETHWSIIEAVAEVLFVEEVVDGDRLMEILDAVERDPKVRLVTLLKARRDMQFEVDPEIRTGS